MPLSARRRQPRRRNEAGFSLVEFVVVTAVTAFIFISVGQLQRDLLVYDRTLQLTISAQQDARRTFNVMSSSLRVAAIAENGSYPLEIAAAQELAYYSDPEGDGTADRYRYFVENGTLKQGLTPPSGSPQDYDPDDEVITDVVPYVFNGATPLFEYFPATYAGSGSALTQPVNLAVIRLVKITLLIDRDVSLPPAVQTFTTQVMLRNLKDNL